MARGEGQSSPLWVAEITSLWRSLVAHWRWVAWSLLRRRHRRHGNCCVHRGHCPVSSTTPSETRAQAGTSGEQRPEQQRKSMKAGAGAAVAGVARRAHCYCGLCHRSLSFARGKAAHSAQKIIFPSFFFSLTEDVGCQRKHNHDIYPGTKTI